MNNYIHDSTSEDYSNNTRMQSSYLQEDDDFDSNILYGSLSDDINVFTDIDQNLFNNRTDKQHELISDCLIYLRSELWRLSNHNIIKQVLPKLYYDIDDQTSTIVFSWVYSTFCATLSFEGEKGSYDAYCAIVFKVDEDSVYNYTKKITNYNYEAVIDELLQLVLYNTER